MAEASNPAQPLQQLLIQSFETLSEEELDEELYKVSDEDIRKVAKHLQKQLLAAKREVAELKTQLIEKDNNEIAYRKEIDELKRKQEGLQTYIDKLEKLIELLGRSVGELQSQVEDLKNDPQHTLAQTALDVALENRVRSDIHSVSLTEILQRLCRLESVQERNEDCRDYEQQDAGRREGPFLS
ncbi:uncharacterized protein LOC134195772 [Corticium candelabrum]|uniref:uncharacterized protein LOC134195772 n=1 Tax=Corticium candelabrum TaxID=121492 RepID=UPI002E260D56|nr:uncharacterized protein LOC134195772 [Corticium candelabrum]